MSPRPNILLITSDQHHHRVMGPTEPRLKTPALDRLCREGIRFERAYCSNPTCTPARASIITGMYPSQHGAWSLGTKLFEDVPTVGDALRASGYFTGIVGKAHFHPLSGKPGMESIECHPTLRDLDFWRKFRGPWYGFDHVETARMHTCEHLVGGHYALWMEEKGFTDWRDYFDDAPSQKPGSDGWSSSNPEKSRKLRASRQWALPQQFHYTTWTGERTIAQIRQSVQEKRPFFIWSSFHDPHPSYLVPEPWATMYDPRDMEPGRLVDGEHDRNPEHFRKTQEHDENYWKRMCEGEGAVHGGHSHLRNPEELKKDIACYYGMVSFMDEHIGRILNALDQFRVADNTLVVFTTDHGHFLGQHGLTAKAIHHYEDLIRIPFIVRWPGKAPAGQVSQALQNLVDLTPSFLGAAGLERQGGITGVNQLPAWCGGAAARTWSVTENHHGYNRFHMRTYVNQRYKITVYRTGEDGELFDLEQDPGEICNLWNEPSALPLRCRLLHEFMQATLQMEPERMPRIAMA